MHSPERASRFLALVLAGLGCACSSDLPRGFDEKLVLTQVGGPKWSGELHKGPKVVLASAGPQRFVPELHSRFERERAFERTRFIDGFYRAPANDGFEATLERVAGELRAAGYGERPGLLLEWIEKPLGNGRKAWTPLAGKLVLASEGTERVLHAFDEPAGRDRTLLPVGAPSCDVSGGIALTLEELGAGEILATDASPSGNVLRTAKERGALAVLSAELGDVNVDRSGKERHLDAIQYRGVRSELPVAMISPRSLAAIRASVAKDPAARLHFSASVKLDERPLRTLVATVLGTDRAHEAVAIASHVQEPGACDNASGVAGVCEAALALAAALQDGKLEAPSRSVVFLFGDEFTQSSMWLDATARKPVAGISADMLGESRELTGARPLLERAPDPANTKILPPDEATEWGSGPARSEAYVASGLALLARCALADVAAIEPGWETAEHPYEGGSDHSVFLGRGLPGVLFWHFTDFAYHTSLDRIEHVDADELRRMSVAVVATALALADPQPGDLDRYLRSNNEERKLRVQAALDAGDEPLAERWRKWTDEVRQWLRVETLRLPPEEQASLAPAEAASSGTTPAKDPR